MPCHNRGITSNNQELDSESFQELIAVSDSFTEAWCLFDNHRPVFQLYGIIFIGIINILVNLMSVY